MGSSDIGKRDLAVLFFMLVSVFKVANGGVYMVGDSAGWTLIGNVDYKEWALNKTFQVGDVIVFNYDNRFHNVMRVSHAEYDACNVSSPMSKHTTGNDSIMIDTHGHHFFMCGAPGHCQAGQKVDISVPRPLSVGPTPSTSPPPSPVTNSPVPTTVTVPAPSPSGTPPIMVFQVGGWLLLCSLFLQVLGVIGLA